jgi:hypothetical protein
MDAPLITLDDAANTTDVYAFVTEHEGIPYLTTALAVYPFEEPGIGPNKYNFDDHVLYQIHVALGGDVYRGRATLSYQFRFKTRFKNRNTILQSYLGVIEAVDDPNQNLTQTYTVHQVDRRAGYHRRRLGQGVVPPNNQGRVTPKYNQDNDGDNPAKEGVATDIELDVYTAQAISQGKFVLPALTHSGPHKSFSTSAGSRRPTECCDGAASSSAPHCTRLWIWVRLFCNDALLPKYSGLGLASQKRRSLTAKPMFMLPRLPLPLQESVGPGSCASVPA